MKIKFKDFLFESAPRIPNDVNYWTKKGKSGKDVCLIFHDDLDGVTSAIIMKHYLIEHGFNIKTYSTINYNESWTALKLDTTLINIAVDFAEDHPDVDCYIDHHGKFSEELRATQQKYSIKTPTGSAAEGIAQQLGVPFSNDTKDWIDMIDSAKYSDYEVDIRGILDFDLNMIKKDPKAKLKFAGAMNQLLKRSDHKTFIEVVNACDEPSIYNIYRLFKLFYPKNNPNFRTGDEAEFVDDAKQRLAQMQKRTKGEGSLYQGYDENGKKIRFMTQDDFWKAFAKNLKYSDIDDEGYPIDEEDPNSAGNQKWQVRPGVYQLIGNIMYVPSGTWANALRAKAIFNQDLDKGIVPNDPKLNFVLLQYGNTLQIADLREKIKDMNTEDLPKDKSGNPIDNLGKYTEQLVENFREHLGFPTKEKDDRIKAGGHWGIGSISNIFGKCKIGPYKDVKFLDMFKNKIINDISGIKWSLTMPWNEEEVKKHVVKPDEINKKLMTMSDVRSEKEALNEKDERAILNYLIVNDISKNNLVDKFNDSTMRKIYQIFLNTNFSELGKRGLTEKDVDGLYFKKNKPIEDSSIFNSIITKFNLDDIYSNDATTTRANQRKELKRIFKIIFNMINNQIYIKKDTESKVANWIK